jgi:hypothetical protein
VYERAVEFFGEDNMDEKMLIAFAKFTTCLIGSL